MSLFSKFKFLTRVLFTRSRMDARLEDELTFHLERETESNVARGMDLEEARRAAVERFGDIDHIRADCRLSWGVEIIDKTALNFRFAGRILLKEKWSSFLIVLLIGLGVGLTTTMFSIINGIYLQPVPYPEGERIYQIRRTNLESGYYGVSFNIATFDKLVEQQTVFETLSGYGYRNTVVLSEGGNPQRFELGRVAADFLEVLRVQPLLGPGFSEGDDLYGAEPKIILGYDVWQGRLGGDPDIIGKQILANKRPTLVVGVMPRGFRFPNNQNTWMPMRIDRSAEFTSIDRATYLRTFGRLRNDVSPKEAESEIRLILNRLWQDDPEVDPSQFAVSLTRFADEYVPEQASRSFYALFGAGILLLFIACSNVINLQLVRYATRTGEFALRSAVGGTALDRARQIFTETFVLCFLGTATGLFVALLSLNMLDSLKESVGLPHWVEFEIDGAVFGYLIGIAVAVTALTAIPPLVGLFGQDIISSLNSDSRSSPGNRVTFFSRGLVVIQIALSLILMIAMALTAKTIHRLAAAPLPFDSANVLTVRVALQGEELAGTDRAVQAYMNLKDALLRYPFIEGVSVTKRLPGMGQYYTAYGVETETYVLESGYPHCSADYVFPDYFELLQVSGLKGRLFDRSDFIGDRNVVVVNQRFAEAVWPGEDPLGKRVQTRGFFYRGIGEEHPWLTVIGVVPNLRMYGITDKSGEEAGLYLPSSLTTNGAAIQYALLRSRESTANLVMTVKDELAKIDPHAPVYFIRPLNEALDELRAPYLFAGQAFSVFALVSLILASVGLYGILSYSVNQKVREFGIRRALGADRRAIMRHVMEYGLIVGLSGLLLGLIGSVVLGRYMTALLYDVSAFDPMIYAPVSLLVGAVVVAACLIPARRAAKLSPSEALREV